MLPSIFSRLANELHARESQVAAAVNLLDEGATVPFIARYRKEVTGGLDDTQLRLLEERLSYLRELEDRRQAIIQSIEEQGKLDTPLQNLILRAETKQALEDLYLPFKPKRRTKAQIAREAGLQPLADQLLTSPDAQLEALATPFLNPETGFADTKSVLDGARHILIETFSEHAPLLGQLRELLWQDGVLKSTLIDGQKDAGTKFSDYFDYTEAIRQVPSHRALALLRGRNEGVLNVSLLLPEQLEDTPPPFHRAEQRIAQAFAIRDQGTPTDKWLLDTVRLAWRAKIGTSLELELINQLREQAESEAIRVFASNLRDLLLAAPAGMKATMGLDPGLRTGVKVAVVDATGKLLETATIYPHAPRNDWNGSLHQLSKLAEKHQVALIAIGNGTASRETDKLAADLIKQNASLGMQKLVVSEAGASVYSASELAAKEFPDLDVSLRGAVSIARRLQDPLAELVKITPKSIGVGQYQHDVNQTQLARALDAVVEDCVNAVGVDLNTASVALLARVSGLSTTLAQNIVKYRNETGRFDSRQQLKKVPRLGEKTFEQAAGFLRVNNGENPLDASAVHPESYPVVHKMLKTLDKSIKEVMGQIELLRQLKPADFIDEQVGLPTVKDIMSELEKPGRDPRPEFKAVVFTEGIETIKDLIPGQIMNGVISNVTNFGAFVDIGVHQDGLVHISALADKFVQDPRQVVKAGDIVKVKVVEVDIPRQRIALTMRLKDEAAKPARPQQAPQTAQPRTPAAKAAGKHQPAQQETAFSAAFAKLKR
ncbi:Tex family protein [Leeia oryzae]|uniref:Tex family protein n=1 Tax=Leeia oryzae TaxID=356662 RepID=UPI0003780933|nr:Tex family protein [Leeia oryzae]